MLLFFAVTEEDVMQNAHSTLAVSETESKYHELPEERERCVPSIPTANDPLAMALHCEKKKELDSDTAMLDIFT